eukprot:CAMPEP_0205816048 /NCGR_PEP_ID=MMETSP0205-20121125/22100_1 /ASSEMBLY_ACC=CAM_ASM_000278 /TAXON_ID=36767 /ORGANISM="Euplotes focardii, Strain TN1" /LENGTH=175 /DNA_ID=CAMNT_0053103533 /DNA_START=64 /DNA_END=587 /DNA_ORIENTATION=-
MKISEISSKMSNNSLKDKGFIHSGEKAEFIKEINDLPFRRKNRSANLSYILEEDSDDLIKNNSKDSLGSEPQLRRHKDERKRCKVIKKGLSDGDLDFRASLAPDIVENSNKEREEKEEVFHNKFTGFSGTHEKGNGLKIRNSIELSEEARGANYLITINDVEKAPKRKILKDIST